jgi:hypothetical protein
MSNQRRGGIIQVAMNGELLDVKGNWTYNLGRAKRDGIVGSDRVHGFSEKVQIPFLEGEITDRKNLDLKKVLDATDATVTMALANGKTFVLRSAWQAGEGTANTEEGNVPVRFEGLDAEEV